MPERRLIQRHSPRELALINGAIWTGPERGVVGDAIAFARGRIVAVGRRPEVLAAVPSAECIDCSGGLVTPGFVDAHAHVRAAASALSSFDLSQSRNTREVLDAISMAASESSKLWLSFFGLETLSPPTPWELQQAAPGRLVRIRHRSLHAWSLSTRALAELGMDTNAQGWLSDDGDIERRFGRITQSDVFEEALRRWSRERLQSGVVAVVDATATNGPEHLGALADWYKRGVILQAPAALVGTPIRAQATAPVPVVGVKISIEPRLSGVRTVADRVREAWDAGWLAAVHCSDTESLGAVVALLDLPDTQRGRIRIEHASVCPPEWLGRVRDLAATVVTHPGFVHAHGDRYLTDGSLEPHEWLYRLRSWRDAGVPLAFGSDAPAGPGDPLLAIRTAITRETRRGATLGPDEKLSFHDALSASTAWAADASGLSGFGRLRVGGRASAVVLSANPFASPHQLDFHVAAVVNGDILIVSQGHSGAEERTEAR